MAPIDERDAPLVNEPADAAHVDAEVLATQIVGDENFRVNPTKARVVPAGGRQILTGLVVNAVPNIDRRQFDRLKAVLRDARTNGADAPIGTTLPTSGPT